MRVLVADDSRVMRRIVARTLRQAGYDWEVLEAEDGVQARDLAMAEQPDLVLSDWNMPNLSGIEMLRSLRRAGCDVPVALVTSEGSPQMRELARHEGALFLIAKPFTAEQFRAEIEQVLE
ncbi:response regulator [Schaalia naturae]|jgi:two-component system chemotaxis response regulator CheY|uniref:Response regulator n=1 Tax=Schaalia naturae TaxID=635203 RepID=A0ABW2SMM5_9ACTO